MILKDFSTLYRRFDILAFDTVDVTLILTSTVQFPTLDSCFLILGSDKKLGLNIRVT